MPDEAPAPLIGGHWRSPGEDVFNILATLEAGGPIDDPHPTRIRQNNLADLPTLIIERRRLETAPVRLIDSDRYHDILIGNISVGETSDRECPGATVLWK